MDRLLRSVAEWNAWKKGVSEEVDLTDVDLSDRTLTGADLSGANLRGANLTRCRFEDCDLSDASLFKINAADASFWKTRICRAYASDAVLTGTQMRQCRIEETSFARAQLEYASFDHSVLAANKFDQAHMEGVSCYGALLVGQQQIKGEECVSRNPGKGATDTHLDFFWMQGDDYAIGPLVRGEEGEVLPPYTESVRRFRRGDGETIKRFAGLVVTIARKHHRLQLCDTIVAAPPSKPETRETAGTRLCSAVTQLKGPRHGAGWLLRTRATLPSRVFSGFAADPERHSSSIGLADPDAVKGRSILLFDDFIGSGATAAACRQLLLEAGAKRVLGIHLGKVIR